MRRNGTSNQLTFFDFWEDKLLTFFDLWEDKLPEPIFDEDHAQDQVIAQIFAEEPIETTKTHKEVKKEIDSIL